MTLKMACREQTQEVHSLAGQAQLICEHIFYAELGHGDGAKVAGWYLDGQVRILLTSRAKAWTANYGQLSYKFIQ